MIVSLLSWYHWGDYVWIEDAKEIFRNRVSRRKRNRGGISQIAISISIKFFNEFIFATADCSTSIDESNKILDDDDIISLADDQSAFSNRSGDSPVDNKYGNLNSSSKC